MNRVAMKTITQLLRQIAGLACLPCILAAVSCQNAAVQSVTKQPVSASRSQWVKVSTQPPTYYPRGISADAATDHWSGEWVYTDDENETRYFIPFRGLGGLDRQSLVKEALSARSESKMAQIAEEDEEILARNLRNMVVFGPPVYGTILLGMMVGVAPTGEVDIYRLEKEWHDARKPH